jgi:hypothetical protein
MTTKLQELEAQYEALLDGEYAELSKAIDRTVFSSVPPDDYDVPISVSTWRRATNAQLRDLEPELHDVEARLDALSDAIDAERQARR